ncbi:unnamed protein product, partial [Urochloa humidicola]
PAQNSLRVKTEGDIALNSQYRWQNWPRYKIHTYNIQSNLNLCYTRLWPDTRGESVKKKLNIAGDRNK